MKKGNLLTKTGKWLTKILKETNKFAYFSLLILFLGLSLWSLGFETNEKPFTVLSSLGCGGLASVVVAWLIEKSNNRIIKRRNESIINQLLISFDTYVMIECERALIQCAKHQDIDIDNEYTISEILSMLEEEKCEAVYFEGFATAVEKGLNGVTEVTLLNFDQSDVGSNLYDTFLALRTTLQTIPQIPEKYDSKEMLKIMVIDCYRLINNIYNIRGQHITYSIKEEDKEHIVSKG